MKKPVIVRRKADADIDRALAYHSTEAPQMVARLIDALEATLVSIGRSPGAGSARFAAPLEFPGLRHRVVRRFPYLVFYIESIDTISILRVLHQRSDIPAGMLDDTP